MTMTYDIPIGGAMLSVYVVPNAGAYLMDATRDQANRLQELLWREHYAVEREHGAWIDIGGEA